MYFCKLYPVYACRSTKTNELKYPLGVMVGFVLQDGWTPLVATSSNGHLEIVKRLTEAGANVNHTSMVVENKTRFFIIVNLHTWVLVHSVNNFCYRCVWIVKWNCILWFMYVQYVRAKWV